MDKTIIDEFVAALNKAKEATYTQIITRLFNNLKSVIVIVLLKHITNCLVK